MAPQSYLSSLDDAMDLLASSTVSDRNKGIEQLSDLIGNRSNLDFVKDSRWAEIFHQLFSVAEAEKSAVLNQLNAPKRSVSKAANLNRLQVVTALIRKLVSSFVSLFKQKAMKLVVNRTLELMVGSDRTLMDPIAIDCIRILRDFLSYRPHLEHLNPGTCSEILAICFSSILDRKLPRDFMLLNNVDFVQTERSLTKSNLPHRQPTASSKTIDSSQLLSMVIPASPSVCLECSKSLLSDFLQVLQRFPRETSAHFHFINALHTLLRELELNKGLELSQSATDLGYCLIKLFSTKNSSLQEQIIICLTYLLPFIIRVSEADQGDEQSSNAEYLLKQVLNVTSNITEFHPKISSISLSTLRLIVPPQEQVLSQFGTKAFSIANCNATNSAPERVQLTIWAALRLGAGTLKYVIDMTFNHSVRKNQTPGKRRKVENELDVFFQGLKPGASTHLIIYRLQILIVTVDLYWEVLNCQIRFQINESINELLDSKETSILDWVFVLLGTMAYCIQPPKTISPSHHQTNRTDTIVPNANNWRQIWTSVIRRTENPNCCRSASYAAFCILTTHRIPAHTAQKDSFDFLHNLQIHPPPFPYDSVCMLVSESLRIGTNNLQFSAYALEQKALLWLTKTWPEVNRSVALGSHSDSFLQRNRRPLSVGFDSEAILLLLTSIAKLSAIRLPPPLSVLPECATTDSILYHEATRSARSSLFCWHESDTFEVGFKPFCSPNQVPGSLSQDTPYHSKLRREISVMLYQSLEKILEEMGAGRNNPEQLLSFLLCVDVQMIIKLLIITLIFQASCQALASSIDQEGMNLIASYFEVILPLVESSKWTPLEHSNIFACFGPILLHPRTCGKKIHHNGLAIPGAASGIALHQRLKSQMQGFTDQVTSNVSSMTPQYERLISQIWSADAVLRSKFDAFRTICERLLATISSLDTSATLGNSAESNLAQTQIRGTTINFDEEDELATHEAFQPYEVQTIDLVQTYRKKTIRTGLGCIGNERSTMLVTNVCIRALVTFTKTSGNLERPIVSPFITSILDDCSGPELVYIGSAVLDCATGGLSSLTGDQAEKLLQNLGQNYLATYAYSQNVNVRKFALQLIQATLNFWKKSDLDGDEDVEIMARQLCNYFTIQMLSGNSRSWEVHQQLSILLDACIQGDPLQRDWGPLELPAAQAKVSSYPSNLLLRFLQDQDYRVRHGAALFVSRVFDLPNPTAFDPVQYWHQVIDHICTESTELEVMFSGSLCITNIFIVSEAIRPRSYLQLLDLLMRAQDLPDEIVQYKLLRGLLQRAACRLGFTSMGDLYRIYAAHVAFERNARGDAPLHFSETFVGKLEDHQKAELVRAHFSCLGCRLYLEDQISSFRTCAQLAGLNELEALELCSPAIAAELLARACTQAASLDSIPSIDHLVQPTLKTMTKLLKLEVDVMQMMSDRVIVCLMCSVHVTSEDGDLISKVVVADSAQRNVFEVLTSKLRKSPLSEPALPFYPILRIAQGMKWLGLRYQLFTDPGLIYNIICHTFTALSESRFTSDCLRFLYSLSIFISFSHLVISSSLPILSLLLQGLIPLLPHDGLFQSVSPFLRWTVGKILLPSNPDLKYHTSMDHLIIAVVEQMKQIVISSSSESDASSAKEFNRWLLNHIAKTNSLGPADYQNLCNNLLLRWPEKHAIPVNDHAIKLLLSSSSGLAFKLVHHLQHHLLLGDVGQTGKILYNLLLSAHDLNTEIEFEDCRRFLELLHLNSGILTSPQVGNSQIYRKSNLEEKSLKSEDDAIAHIFAVVISRLQTSIFKQMRSLTDFLQRASTFENFPDFNQAGLLVRHLEIERATLARRGSTVFRSHSENQIMKPEYVLDKFVTLDEFAHSKDQWTRAFLKLLIATRVEARPFYAQLVPLIETNDELAAEFLPLVLYSCLLAELDSNQTDIRTKVSNHISTILTSSSTDSVVITRVINLLTYLRYHERPGTDPLGRDKWLDVSWLKLAECATRQGMSTSGFLFLEVAREQGLSIDLSKPLDRSLQSFLEQLFRCSPEPDAFYSLIPSDPRNFLLQRYQHERQWESAFGFHGAILEGLNAQSQSFSKEIPSLAGYLSACGLSRLAHTVLHTSTFDQSSNSAHVNNTGSSSTLPFELAWRASVWDLPVSAHLDSDSSTRIYGSLRSCHCDRENDVKINVAKSALVGQFKQLIKDTADRVQPSSQAIGSALALRDIVIWLENKQDVQSLIILPSDCPYDVLERISSVRQSLLQAVTANKNAAFTPDQTRRSLWDARDAELKLRIETSRAARHCGNLQSAINIITPFADLIDDQTGDTTLKAKEEFAEVLWAKGERALALSTLKSVHALQSTLPQSALQLCRIGEWIAFARLNSAKEIIDSCFEKAIQSLNKSEHPDAFGQVSYTYAKLADAEYYKLVGSEEIKKLTASTQRLKAEIGATAKLVKSNPSAQAVMKLKMRLYQEDNTQLQSLSELQNRYLSSSLEMYLACLAHCDRHDDAVFRIVSLWLDHHSNKSVNMVLQSHLRSVPTHKFIRVSHQLAARLSDESGSEFQKTLGQFIVDLCKDHPFHIIFQILLLQRGIKSAGFDDLINSRSRRISNISTPANDLSPSELSRAQAASNLIAQVAQIESRKEVVNQLIVLHKAYKEWALFDVPSPPKGIKPMNQIPSKMFLRNLKDLSVPVPTERIPIDKSCRYISDSMPCISSYDPTFKLASGLHKPKITRCLASNGMSFVQLFKGGDDVRQDAIMEQVFEMINEVLKREPECQKRMLNFKTYNVIPLSPDAGVIQFVMDTLSLSEILLPMHRKYNEPPDWNVQKLRQHLGVQGNTEARIKRYREILPHCRPAMRFWFLETQKCPQKWYEMRLNFARSTATTSIIGHILGLGDRHLSNILIDKNTGELVQIDLGIAFDAGKQLPIPETIPFRLSRDMVDGFGVAKTEGVFRRCCELTLRVMRENKTLIMTIMDVLKHDLLKSWIVTEQEEKLMQGVRDNLDKNKIGDHQSNQSEARISEKASRALAAVENKLSNDLSVETTVNQLIQEATSIENLGSLFHGWSAFY